MSAIPSGWGPPYDMVVAVYLAKLGPRARPSAVKAARVALDKLQREMPVVTVLAAMDWQQKRSAAGAANATVNNDLAYLRAALKCAVRLGILPYDPLAALESLPIKARDQRRRKRALTDWELSRLLAAAEASDARRPTRFPQAPLLFALMSTGQRWGSLTQTVWRDLDVGHAMLTMRAETSKTQREYKIPLRVDVLESMLALREPTQRVTGSPPSPGSRIFLTATGKPQYRTVVNFRTWFIELLDEAGIPQKDETGAIVSVHALRHTFVDRMDRARTPVRQAMDLSGHASERMILKNYNHSRAEAAREFVEALPPIGATSRARPLEGEGSSPHAAAGEG